VADPDMGGYRVGVSFEEESGKDGAYDAGSLA